MVVSENAKMLTRAAHFFGNQVGAETWKLVLDTQEMFAK